MKFLSIDYGDKKIGLAMADLETKLASPYKIMAKDANLMANISNICALEKIDKIVVGVPTGLRGVKSVQYEKVIDFIKQLKKAQSLEVINFDENLTSSYAKRLLQGTKSKGQDDDVAAMLILQSYLDSLNN